MSTPQEVVAEAMRMATGSKLDRARAGMAALNLFTQLPPDDKRELAVLVAQRIAPNLVPRIQAETGMEMTAEQSQAVLDMVRRLDGEDLAQIQAALGSSEARRDTLGSVGTTAAAATGVADVVGATRVAAATDGDHHTAESEERSRARVRVLGERLDQVTEELADARAAVSVAEGRARTAEAALHSTETRADEAERRAQDQARAADRARTEARAAADRSREAEEHVRRMEARKVAAADVVDRFAGPGTSTATHAMGRPDERSLAGRMRTASASGALRMLVQAIPSLATMSPAERRGLVAAIPDGWARRKAVQRLVEAGAVTHDEAPGLLADLASTGNQVFAAATMLETGVLAPDDLVDAVRPEALTRLRRRLPTA